MEIFSNKFILFLLGFIAIYIINIFRCETGEQFIKVCSKNLIIYCIIVLILVILNEFINN